MTVASPGFIAFVVLVGLVCAPAWSVRSRQLLLLAANLGFLATFISSPVQALPLLGFLAAGYAGLQLVRRGLARAGFGSLLAFLVVLFFWLKRYSFLPEQSFLPFAYSVIGLSYIFFRVLHVVIDTHQGAISERISPVAYLNYVLNFTSLVSGPIQRYQDYAAQLLRQEPPGLDWVVLGRAVERIVTGLFKVVVLAAILFSFHERMLNAFEEEATLIGRVLTALGAATGYTFYLYCNFSGYTDIVIGAARLYRLELPENFNRPFSATNFIDFWTRWHMTLSNWLRTYVYNPLLLTLARHSSQRARPYIGVLAFFVTFFLIGLWHGQTSVFAVYGVLLGAGVSANKLYQLAAANWLGRKRYRAMAERPAYRALARGLTFSFFTFSLMFFWGDWSIIGRFASGLGLLGATAAAALLVLAASITLSAGIALRDLCLRLRAWGTPILISRYSRTVWVTTMATAAAAAMALLATPAPDIVYKTF